MNMNELLNSPSLYGVKLHITKELPKRVAAFTVDGNCMEGKQIFDGDTVLVALDHMPRRGDPCICIIHGKPMFKVFLDTAGNNVFTVGTAYRWSGKSICFNPDGSSTMNMALFATEIGGVIIGCFDQAGEPRWINDYRSYPKELPTMVQNPDSNASFLF